VPSVLYSDCMAIARQLMDPRNAAEVEDAMRYTPTLTPHIPDVVIVGVGIWRYCIRHHSWYHASARAVATLCHETCTSQPPPQTTHIHTYTYTHIHTHSTPPNHTYTHIHIHTHTNTHTHTHTHTHTTTQHNTTHQTHF